MTTFETGEWVRFRDSNGRLRSGHVTAAKAKTVRLVDLSGRQYTTSNSQKGEKIAFSDIRSQYAGVFVLDTQLDGRWRNRRESARFWEEYCRHADWQFGFERVHSLADLEHFFAERVVPFPVVIFSGHGDEKSGWEMTNGDVLGLGSDLRVSEKNRGKVILISACDIGANAKLCLHLKEVFGARAVIAYSSEVYDDICFLVEPALVQLMFESDDSPAKCVATVCRSFQPWKKINQPHAKKFPLVCY